MAKVLLATQGSLGDLHPFVAMGQALKRLGAKVTLASHPDYAQKVTQAGLIFAPYGPDFTTLLGELGMSYAQMVRLLADDPGFLIERMMAAHVPNSIEQITAHVTQADIVVGSSFAYGAHISAQVHAKPFALVGLQPAVFLSAYDPPKSPHAPFILSPQPGLGVGYNRVLITLGHVRFHRALKAIRTIYRVYGLKTEPSLAGIREADLTLGLYSHHFGKVEPDFPPHSRIVGFPAFDSEDGGPSRLPEVIETFLTAGRAPLVFSLGSAVVYDAEAYYRTAIAAAKTLKARCVILSGPESPLLNEDHGPDLLISPYAPHSLLFPKASAIIHHGGIGTTAQALRSGRPQMVSPVFGDQFDNAERVKRLKVGTSLPFTRFTHNRACASLSGLLSDTALESRAHALATDIRGEDGAERAAEALIAAIRNRAHN